MSSTLEAISTQILLLRSQLASVEAHAESIRQRLQHAEATLFRTKQAEHASQNSTAMRESDGESRWPLAQNEYQRYGRQMILKEVGLAGQLRLKRAKVLVVGVGGLGCPAAAYLAGAGVSKLGLVDGDVVEESNLHRQVAHTTDRIEWGKAESAREYLKAYVARDFHYHYYQHIFEEKEVQDALELNPLVEYSCHAFALSAETAIAVVEQYDLVLDCTDHPTSRYLISDACIVAGKPLVSASALRTDGQLIVLNNPPRPPGDNSGGPCYRCIFPKPPPADSVLSCGEGGILGPVVGTMGVLQALEAIKLLLAEPASASNIASDTAYLPKASMLMFSAYSNPPFRQVRMRGRHASCAACSATPKVTRESLTSGSLDYIAFCGGLSQQIELLDPASRISPIDYAHISKGGNHVLVDVRDATQYEICALPESLNVPWTGNAKAWLEHARQSGVVPGNGSDCYVVCRFGNDSQLAVNALLEATPKQNSFPASIKDIQGGFQAWRREVDPTWPEY